MSTQITRDQQSLSAIEAFLAEVGGPAKTAAEANTETGSQGGETSHPVKNVDDSTQKAETGARAAENTKDVKDMIAGPAMVDSTKPASAGTAKEDQLQIGTTKAPTGEQPSVETGSVKGDKDDPGTSHPASADNKSIDGGQKFGGDVDAMDLAKLANEVRDLGNEICATIAAEAGAAPAKQAAAPAAFAPATKQAEIDPTLAQHLGWEMAGLVTGNFDKAAADSLVQSTLAGVIKEAADDADNVIGYLNDYAAAVQASQLKHAQDPNMLAAMAGGAPEAGAGGVPSGDGGAGGEGGQGGQGEMGPEEIEQLLQQLGVTPEELMQILQDEQAGEGAGGEAAEAGAGAGGMPAGGMAAGGPPGMEAQASAGGGKKSMTAKPEAKAAVDSYIREVVGRSRAKKAAAAAAAK